MGYDCALCLDRGIIRAPVVSPKVTESQLCTCVKQDLAALRRFVVGAGVRCPDCWRVMSPHWLRGIQNEHLVDMALGTTKPPLCPACAHRKFRDGPDETERGIDVTDPALDEAALEVCKRCVRADGAPRAVAVGAKIFIVATQPTDLGDDFRIATEKSDLYAFDVGREAAVTLASQLVFLHAARGGK